MVLGAFFLLCWLLSNSLFLVEACEDVSQCFTREMMTSAYTTLEGILSDTEELDDVFNKYLDIFKIVIDTYQSEEDPFEDFLREIIYNLCSDEEDPMEVTSISREIKNQSPSEGITRVLDCSSEDDPMRAMLDAMEQMNTGKESFDKDYYSTLHACFDYIDPTLSLSQTEAWSGIIEYWKNNGTESDLWGENDGGWLEQNETVTNLCNMTIYEPCNYASNVAYYHIVTEVCACHQDPDHGFSMDDSYVRALAQAFSMIGMGSAFMHGTNTDLGGQQDVKSNDLFPYIQHQASLSSLSDLSPILTDLSTTKRNKTGIEIAAEITAMYYSESVFEWYDHTESFDMPDIVTSFTALFSTILTIGFDDEVVKCLLGPLSCLFGVSNDTVQFMINDYIPELRSATEGFELTSVERVKFIGNSVGMVLKFVYALLFQEDVLVNSYEISTSGLYNALGGCLLPRFNVRAGQFQTFPYYEKEFQLAENIYPGDYGYCNKNESHAKWHLESAIGILDMTYLVDQIHYFYSRLN